MINYNDFIKSHLGRGVDVDGAAGVQCVDLIKAYLAECFGIKAGAWGNAKEYFESFAKKDWGGNVKMNAAFTRIKNTPDFVPQKGDICVFGARFAKGHNCGHIGIAAEGSTVSRIMMYDQNGAGNHDACKLSSYGYTSRDFLGVLRPKNQSIFEKQKYVVTAGRLNVRSGAGTQNKVVDVISAGTLVTVLETRGDWARIGVGRWVNTNYIKAV